MNKGWRILKWTAVGILGILFVLLFGWVTMSLWNWLVPALFNGPVLTYWQAMGLLVLSKILLGGFGGHKGGHRGGMYWKRHYYKRFSSMSPEERERFKERMREKWCYREKPASGENTGTSNV